MHENAALFQDGKANLEDYRSALSNERPAQVRRHEAWRMAHRAERYLLALSVTELMARGRTVFEELSPHFLIGGHGKDDLMEIMRRWSDFLEECELRNIDMRQFTPADPAID